MKDRKLMPVNDDLHVAAIKYLEAGLSCVPGRNPEAKRPKMQSWKFYQQGRMPQSEMDAHFAASAKPQSLCIICGEVSGKLECLDFDSKNDPEGVDAYYDWSAAFDDADFNRKIYRQSTPSGGRHVVYRLPEGADMPGNRKLRTNPETGKAFVETRGEGGLFLVAPTVGYQAVGKNLGDLEPLTEDEYAALMAAIPLYGEGTESPPKPSPKTGGAKIGGGEPAEDYLRTVGFGHFMAVYGWSYCGESGQNELYSRPGKTPNEGYSATWNGHVFFVHSSNALPFAVGAYSPLDVIAVAMFGERTTRTYNRAYHWLRGQGFGNETPPPPPQAKAKADAQPKPVEIRSQTQPAPSLAFPDAIIPAHGFIREFVDACMRADRPQPGLAFGAALVAASTLWGRRVRLDDGTAPNVYVIAVANSGSGKEYPRAMLKKVLGERDIGMPNPLVRLLGAEGVTSASAIHTMLSQGLPQCLLVDEMAEMLAVAADARRNPMVAGIITEIMKLYSAAEGIYLPMAYADRTKGKTLANPFLTFHGSTTPSRFYGELRYELLRGGYINRHIIIHALDETPLPNRHKTPPTMTAGMTEYVERCYAARFGAKAVLRRPSPGEPEHLVWEPVVDWTPTTLHRTEEAKNIHHEHNVRTTQEANRIRKADRDSVLPDIFVRATETAKKLSMLIHLSEGCGTDEAISQAHAEWSVMVADHVFGRLATEATAQVAETPFGASALKAIGIIARYPDGCPRKTLLKAMHIQSFDLDKIVDTLLESGRIAISEQPTKGRPTILYTLPSTES